MVFPSLENLRNDSISLGATLAQFRLKRQLAKHLRMTPSTIQNYLDGFVSDYSTAERVVSGAIEFLKANGIDIPTDLHYIHSDPGTQVSTADAGAFPHTIKS